MLKREDVVTGASALAGLFLVFLGSSASSFSSFDREQQNAVRGRFQVRGWLAFVGIILAILAAVLALIGKWLGSEFLTGDAVALLVIALLWGAWLALIAARDIR